MFTLLKKRNIIQNAHRVRRTSWCGKMQVPRVKKSSWTVVHCAKLNGSFCHSLTEILKTFRPDVCILFVNPPTPLLANFLRCKNTVNLFCPCPGQMWHGYKWLSSSRREGGRLSAVWCVKHVRRPDNGLNFKSLSCLCSLTNFDSAGPADV